MISVLYVDDEPDLLEISKLFLEQGGEFAVDVTTSATAALGMISSKNYDAIISDYQMPGMDGIAFLKKVRSSGNVIPFILFTGRGREEIVIQALNEGANFYLQKGGDPVAQFAELTHQVQQAVWQRRAEISIRDLERREADIINFLPDATFAIDRSGRIIAWNRAIEEMTGVPAADMLGKGNYEYAIPFYGQRRPILIDLINEPDEVIAGKYSHIIRKKDILIADTTLPRPMGKPLTLMGKASPLYNREGGVIGAIESIRDISEMKKAEENLRESEEQFGAFMDHLPVTAFIKDAESTNLFVNRQMVELFGEQEWIGKPVYDQFPREAAEKMIEDDRLTIRDGYRKSTEYLVIKNGDKRIFETHKFRIDRDNKPPLIGGFAIDITEQKEVERALNESEMRFRKIFENSPLGMALVTPDFRFFSVNPAWASMTGYSVEELLAKSFTDITHPDHLAGDMDRVKELAAGTIPVYSTEKRYIRKDGTILRGLISVTAIRDQDGALRYFAAQIEDITDRKKAEEELRFRNLIFSTEQETSLDAIIIVDENGGILNYNQKFAAIWRIPENLFASRTDGPVLQFVTTQAADPEEFLTRVRYLYDHRDEKSFEEIQLKDGRILERFSAPILGEGKQYYGRVWYFRDVTGRRKAEHALQDVNRKLNLLSKITRHDINNQLTLLQGYLKILGKKAPALFSLPEFPKAETAAGRIFSMIQFTREYEEIGVNAPVWLDCHALVDRAASQIASGPVRIKNDLPAGRELLADPLVVRVFYNLMDNAMRYGGKITFIRFFLQESEGVHRILCEDDGEGVPADEKEQIFERNFGRNTGLGLFLSREILGITGMTIRETGVPGEGARFEILVPESACRFSGPQQE